MKILYKLLPDASAPGLDVIDSRCLTANDLEAHIAAVVRGERLKRLNVRRPLESDYRQFLRVGPYNDCSRFAYSDLLTVECIEEVYYDVAFPCLEEIPCVDPTIEPTLGSGFQIVAVKQDRIVAPPGGDTFQFDLRDFAMFGIKGWEGIYSLVGDGGFNFKETYEDLRCRGLIFKEVWRGV